MGTSCLDQRARRTTIRDWAAVVSLMVVVFVEIATEMMPVGILPLISDEFEVNPGIAGLTISVYGLVAGLSAPLIASALRYLDRRRLMVGIGVIFVGGNLLTAAAPNIAVLLGARILLGLVTGVLWAVVATVAVRIVSAEHAVRATTIVFAGISLAGVLGVPAGAWIGNLAGWRWAFVALSALSVAAVLALLLFVPALPAEGGAVPLRNLPVVLHSRGMRTALAATFFLVVGHYAAFTYLAPYLLDRVHLNAAYIAPVLLGVGCAGVVGTGVGGVILERVAHVRTVLLPAALVVALLVGLLAPLAGPVVVVVAALLAWGCVYAVVPIALQTLVLRVAPTATEAASSLYVLVFNVAIAVGSVVGGVVLDGLGAWAVMAIAALIVASGAIPVATEGPRSTGNYFSRF